MIPRPGIRRPPRRHLRLATHGRSPSRTAVGARVVPPVDGLATASPDDRHDQLLDASLLPSQLLTIEVLRRPVESALAATIGVVHQPFQAAAAGPDGHLERVQGQVGAQRPGSLPADQEAAEGVDDKGHINKAGPGGDVGEVGHPQLVGPGCREVPRHQVGWPRRGHIRRGRPASLPAADACKVKLAHQALHGAAGHHDPFPVQLPPDLAGTVDAEVVPVDPGDLSLQLLVSPSPGRGRPTLGGVVGRRGDRQHLADRLDPEPVPVLVDVGDHLPGRRSSSAAKKAEALFRISLARRSSRFSCSSCLSR